ncbi:DNA primase [Polymorphobacter glacialis]|uniref:DNA primase n=1 Tax=Sandarakinorhabdus glacialis TaxID=1614636 RepID=A0A916ZML7_9SPHN|nr:DNA primase [Polymorphobacter glacialis]GGE04773.1 DNA primase [Polymorphobacter glacialis]
MSLPPAFLDELRARVPLAPVVGRRVKLTRAGREWKGCCPFHNEKTPSFYVNDDKGFYHCFGCGAHGDVIKFLTEQEGLGFIDAVKQLASQAGMEVPSETPEARARAEVADTLQSLAGRAADWFTAQLKSPAGAAARDYLERRGVSAKMVKDFAIGFAPDGKTSLKTALKDAGEDRLVEAGLLGRSDNGETYDRFRGRLMFPIRDRRGRVVGFGGRALGDVQPKYLNSADGPLFDKGRLLYNLDRAGPTAHKSGRLVVVEGYMDVIGVAQAGIAELVAPLGTAMTEAQLALAWRQVDEPILCFDGDGAGQKAALRACLRALPLLAPAKSLRIATLPHGEDPDDLVKRGGATAFEAVLAGALPLIEYLWRSETEGIDTATPERRAAVRQRLRAHSDAIAEPSVRALYAADFSARFDALYLARPERVRKPFVPGQKFVAPKAGASAALRAWGGIAQSGSGEVTAILAGLLVRPALADRYGETLAALPLADPRQAALRDAILSALAMAPDLESADLAHDLGIRGVGELASAAVNSNRLRFSFTRAETPADVAARDFGMLIDTIAARTRIEIELAAATARFRGSMDDRDFSRQQALLAERVEVDSAMMRLAESLRGD